MNRYLTTALFFLAVSTARAQVQDVATYCDPRAQLAVATADESTWVIFDIDNTLLKPTSMMGSHQWGDYMRTQAESAGQPKADANRFQHSAFSRVQPALKVEITEAAVLPLIRSLQKNNVVTFALTARDESIADVTLRQTNSLGFDFSKSVPKLSGMNGSGFHSGLLFSGETPKGELLKRLIAESAVKPKRVVFFDDRGYNLDSVGKTLTEAGIEFVGFRYSRTDQDIAEFRADIASVQWLEFKRTGKALSNAEALRLMTTH